jgi:hypothetical protein
VEVVKPVEEVKLVEEVKPVEDKKNIKTVELVECPKCGKKLTQRTLKYSHEAKCPKNDNPPPATVKPDKVEKIL